MLNYSAVCCGSDTEVNWPTILLFHNPLERFRLFCGYRLIDRWVNLSCLLLMNFKFRKIYYSSPTLSISIWY